MLSDLISKADLSSFGISGILDEANIFQMMTEDNRDMNLGLAPIYPNQSVQTRLNTDSGAGANADSRIDMAFVASDPLSELVWSPHRGLSLKCADCGLTEKKHSCLWDVGPSNMVLSPTHSIRSRGASDDKTITERKITASEVEFHVNSEAVKDSYLPKSPRSSAGLEFGSSHAHQSGQESQRTSDFQLLLTNESNPELVSGKVKGEDIINHSGRIEDVASGSQMLGLEIALAPKVHIISKCDVLDDPMSKSLLQSRTLDESAMVMQVSRAKIETRSSNNALLESLESSAENDIPHLIGKDACRKSEERSRMDKASPVEASGTPTGSRIHLLQRKGKEKALFSTDIIERISKDEDDSHDSVESCNSASLFSSGKRQWSFAQQLIVGNKRIKRQIHEAPTATSLVRQDSSFVNWISNMVKGLAKVNQDECPLALTLNHPGHELESYDKKNDNCNKAQNSRSGNMGFQSIFQSLYCPNTNLRETKMSNVNYPVSGAKELVEAEKTCISVMPISFCGENDESCKQFLAERNNFNHDTSGNGGGLSTQPLSQPQILSVDIASTLETCKFLSSENKNLNSLAFIKEKNEVSSSDTLLDKQKSVSSEYNSLHSQCEGKAIPNIDHKNDPLRSLWITRFSSKTRCPVSNLDHCASTYVMPKHPTGCTKCIHQNLIDSPFRLKNSVARENSAEDPVNAVGKDTRNDATSTEASIGFKRVLGHNYEKSIYRLKSPSPILKSSEGMASLFAKRLEALKSITPSDDATHLRTTCYFCGKSGHNICNCSEVNTIELEDLLRSINSHDVAEGSPCLCIKCFQLGHWAIACPDASSSRQRRSNNDASVFHHRDACTVQLHEGSEPHCRMFIARESHSQVGEDSSCNGKIPQLETDLSFSPVSKGKMVLDGRDLCLDEVQNHISSNYKVAKLKEIQVKPLYNSASKHISDAPNMFDAIRRLRLSRTDILKLTNSHMSLSRLDGFFLRLRLGKWEKRLAGTGYYVACINETQREKRLKDSKNSIYVSVGGIKCLVESRYVSNHDFLEDELMTWWHTTSRSGEIPTEDDLRSKFKERQKLGI